MLGVGVLPGKIWTCKKNKKGVHRLPLHTHIHTPEIRGAFPSQLYHSVFNATLALSQAPEKGFWRPEGGFLVLFFCQDGSGVQRRNPLFQGQRFPIPPRMPALKIPRKVSQLLSLLPGWGCRDLAAKLDFESIGLRKCWPCPCIRIPMTSSGRTWGVGILRPVRGSGKQEVPPSHACWKGIRTGDEVAEVTSLGAGAGQSGQEGVRPGQAEGQRGACPKHCLVGAQSMFRDTWPQPAWCWGSRVDPRDCPAPWPFTQPAS